MRGPTFWGPAPELHIYFFAFLLNRIFYEGTYFLGTLPLNYKSIFLPFYLTGLFWMNYISFFVFLPKRIFLMRGPTFRGPCTRIT